MASESKQIYLDYGKRARSTFVDIDMARSVGEREAYHGNRKPEFNCHGLEGGKNTTLTHLWVKGQNCNFIPTADEESVGLSNY